MESLQLLGTAAGGSAVGMLSSVVSIIADSIKEHQERAAAREQALIKASQAYADSTSKVVEMSSTENEEKRITFCGKSVYEKSLANESNKPYTPPRNRAIAWAIFLLVTTYCAVLLLWANSPGHVLQTINPTTEPASRGVLQWIFGWPNTSTEVIEITTGGAALTLLYPMVFVISVLLTNLGVGQLRNK